MRKALLLMLLLVGLSYGFAWNQTTTDWDTQTIDRYQTFTFRINATNSSTITYSDNDSAVIIDEDTGVTTWKPHDDFVGVHKIRYNTSNTTTQLTNVVAVTVNYVDYYQKPGNMTNMGDLFDYSNEITNFAFGKWILIAVFMITFAGVKMFPTEQAFLVAATMTAIMSYLMFVGGWIDVYSTTVATIALVIAVIIMVAKKK